MALLAHGELASPEDGAESGIAGMTCRSEVCWVEHGATLGNGTNVVDGVGDSDAVTGQADLTDATITFENLFADSLVGASSTSFAGSTPT